MFSVSSSADKKKISDAEEKKQKATQNLAKAKTNQLKAML
jgi:hypothetical protein